MLPNLLMVLSGKGGVAKTSLSAHIAGLAAASGWHVLAVDLDKQGNLARDLGYVDRSDGGKSLFEATVVSGGVPDVLTEVRPGLDVVAGGPRLVEMGDLFSAAAARGADRLDRLEEALAPVAPRYDLVVLDMPPGESWVSRAGMRFCNYVVVPTKTDEASFDGVGEVYAQLRDSGSRAEVLGVAITLVTSGAKAVVRHAREVLEAELGESAPVFEHTIRYAEAAAVDCRRRGILAYEYEEEARAAAKRRFELLRSKKRPERFSSAASGLAADYHGLVNEILGRWVDRVQHRV